MAGVSFNRLKSGGMILVGGEITAQACGFIRNLIVARTIQPEDFGIAAAIATVASLVEIIAGLDVGRFLTRKHDKNIDNWLGVAHFVVVMRGIISALALLLVGGFMADFMKMPEHAWAFHLIALLPFIRSLSNLSMWVEQRHFNYKPLVLCQSIPQIFSLLSTFPVLYYIQDFRALVLLTILNATVYVFLSHVITPQKYKLHFSTEKLKELWAYSAPLWLDGMLMFCVLQGERIIVTREFGLALAGIYSVAFLISWTPAAIIGRLGQSLGVPHFSQLLNNRDRIERDYWLITVFVSAAAIGFSLVFSIASSSIITFVFGAAYSTSTIFIILLGGHYAFRICRIPPTIIALASGHTKCIAQANLIRVTGVGISWLVAITTNSLEQVFLVALTFEALAGLWLFFAVRNISGIHPWTLCAIVASIIATTILGMYWGDTALYRENSDILNITLGVVFAMVGTGISIILLMKTRQDIATEFWSTLRTNLFPKTKKDQHLQDDP